MASFKLTLGPAFFNCIKENKKPNYASYFFLFYVELQPALRCLTAICYNKARMKKL